MLLLLKIFLYKNLFRLLIDRGSENWTRHHANEIYEEIQPNSEQCDDTRMRTHVSSL